MSWGIIVASAGEMILIERLLNTWNLLALITSNDNTCMIIDLHLYRDAIFVRVSIFKLIESVYSTIAHDKNFLHKS